eukprot:scaffold20807_cov51-Phaeocystis_antarctica.AAC.3
MDAVPSPRWYLFSGQADPTAMSFDAEPWDATCEAEGTGTRDTLTPNPNPNPNRSPTQNLTLTLPLPLPLTRHAGHGARFCRVEPGGGKEVPPGLLPAGGRHAWCSTSSYLLTTTLLYALTNLQAVDAFYLAGPGVAPPNNLRLSAGTSTTTLTL